MCTSMETAGGKLATVADAGVLQDENEMCPRFQTSAYTRNSLILLRPYFGPPAWFDKTPS